MSTEGMERPPTVDRVRRLLRGRRGRLVAGAAAVVAAVAVVSAALGSGGGGAAQDASVPAVTTATVVRTTLLQTEQVPGTLGYGESSTIMARSAQAGAATSGGALTWLPAVGAVIERGQTVYAVDGSGVVLLYGDTPLYRQLVPGVAGADVTELERNLADLGYMGFTIDDTYTDATADAVCRWQNDLGVAVTGRVDMTQAVVAPGPIRIASRVAELGFPASGPVLTYTGTTRIVTVALDVAYQHLVTTDMTADVTLPAGTRVTGRISQVGTVATSTSTGTGAGASTKTTVEVLVAVEDQAALGSYDGAPVQLTITTAVREDVLAVPVAALVALAEGGYGVELVDGTRLRYVAVETGMFAGSLVEVSGPDITEGAVVVVPA